MGYQAAQSCHAMTEFFLEHPDITKAWHDNSNYIAVLAVENEEKLIKLFQKAQARGVRCSCFREPDMDDQITAIVLEPGLDSKRLSGHIKLMG
jgi:peptidyl-tRNA hydrolase